MEYDYGVILYRDGRELRVAGPRKPKWSDDMRFLQVDHDGGTVMVSHEDLGGFTVHKAERPGQCDILDRGL